MPTEAQAALRVEGLHKAFQERSLMSQLSFSLGAQELLAVHAPLGGGKSTLLHLIQGRELPDRGHIFRPLPVLAWGQGGGLWPWLKAQENLVWLLRRRGHSQPEAQEQALALLAQVGAQSHSDCFLDRLSGSMRHRVELARLMAMGPGIWVLDDPFAELHGKARQDMHVLLMALLRKQARAVLLLTSDLAEALALGDRVLGLSPQAAHGAFLKPLPAGPRPRPLHGPTMSKAFAECIASLQGARAATAPLQPGSQPLWAPKQAIAPGSQPLWAPKQAIAPTSPLLPGEAPSALTIQPLPGMEAWLAASESCDEAKEANHRDASIMASEDKLSASPPSQQSVKAPLALQAYMPPSPSGPLLSPFGPGFGFVDKLDEHQRPWAWQGWGLALGALVLLGLLGYGFDQGGGWEGLLRSLFP